MAILEGGECVCIIRIIDNFNYYQDKNNVIINDIYIWWLFIITYGGDEDQ